MHPPHFTYFPIRGVLEPALLLLIDSDTPYTLDEITCEEWHKQQCPDNDGNDDGVKEEAKEENEHNHHQSQNASKNSKPPPTTTTIVKAKTPTPFRNLPCMKIGTSSGLDLVIGEMNAIGQFLDDEVRWKGSPSLQSFDRARLMMISSASLSFLDRLFAKTSDRTWLCEPSLRKTLNELVIPHLEDVETQLERGFYPPLVLDIPSSPGKTPLTYSGTILAYTLSLIAELFPCLLFGLGDSESDSGSGSLTDELLHPTIPLSMVKNPTSSNGNSGSSSPSPSPTPTTSTSSCGDLYLSSSSSSFSGATITTSEPIDTGGRTTPRPKSSSLPPTANPPAPTPPPTTSSPPPSPSSSSSSSPPPPSPFPHCLTHLKSIYARPKIQQWLLSNSDPSSDSARRRRRRRLDWTNEVYGSWELIVGMKRRGIGERVGREWIEEMKGKKEGKRRGGEEEMER